VRNPRSDRNTLWWLGMIATLLVLSAIAFADGDPEAGLVGIGSAALIALAFVGYLHRKDD
jgi:hypothetical protein